MATPNEILVDGIQKALGPTNTVFGSTTEVKEILTETITKYNEAVEELQQAEATKTQQVSNTVNFNEFPPPPPMGKEAFMQQYVLTARRDGVGTSQILSGLKDGDYEKVYDLIHSAGQR